MGETVGAYESLLRNAERLSACLAAEEWSEIEELIRERATLVQGLLRRETQGWPTGEINGLTALIRRVLDADREVATLVATRMNELASALSDHRRAREAYGADVSFESA